MRWRWLWPLMLLLLTIGAALVVFAAPDTPLRAFVVMAFLFLCPGMAVVRLLHLNDVIAELTLGVALSLALGAIVAGIFLYAGHWSPPGILITLLLFSFIGSTAQLVLLHPAAARRLRALWTSPADEHLADSETIQLISFKLAAKNAAAQAPQKRRKQKGATALATREPGIEAQKTAFMPAISTVQKPEASEKQGPLLMPAQNSAQEIEKQETIAVPALAPQQGPGTSEEIEKRETVHMPGAPTVTEEKAGAEIELRETMQMPAALQEQKQDTADHIAKIKTVRISAVSHSPSEMLAEDDEDTGKRRAVQPRRVVRPPHTFWAPKLPAADKEALQQTGTSSAFGLAKSITGRRPIVLPMSLPAISQKTAAIKGTEGSWRRRGLLAFNAQPSAETPSDAAQAKQPAETHRPEEAHIPEAAPPPLPSTASPAPIRIQQPAALAPVDADQPKQELVTPAPADDDRPKQEPAAPAPASAEQPEAVRASRPSTATGPRSVLRKKRLMSDSEQKK